jgi:hypothetical protein
MALELLTRTTNSCAETQYCMADVVSSLFSKKREMQVCMALDVFQAPWSWKMWSGLCWLQRGWHLQNEGSVNRRWAVKTWKGTLAVSARALKTWVLAWLCGRAEDGCTIFETEFRAKERKTGHAESRCWMLWDTSGVIGRTSVWAAFSNTIDRAFSNLVILLFAKEDFHMWRVKAITALYSAISRSLVIIPEEAREANHNVCAIWRFRIGRWPQQTGCSSYALA